MLPPALLKNDHPITTDARGPPQNLIPTSTSPISSPTPPDIVGPPITSKSILDIHHNPTAIPRVCPCNMLSPCKNCTTFDTLGLHKIFGCQRFFHPNHLAAASFNAKLIHTGELLPTLGSFATIGNPPTSKNIKKHRKYLDKCHMDIVHGNTLSFCSF